MYLSSPWFKNSWLKSSGLKKSWLKSLGLKGHVLKIGVEKSGVEISFNHLKDHINTNHLKISLNTYQKKKLKKEGVETLNSKLKCEYCPAFFAQKGSLERHIAKYHPEKRFSAENDPLDNSNHTCSKCGKKFTSLLNYSDHCNQVRR